MPGNATERPEPLELLDAALDDVSALVGATDVPGAGVDLDLLGSVLLGLERHRSRLEALWAVVVGRFEAAGGPQVDGAWSAGNWVAARTGCRRGTANGRVGLARKLARMPATAAAYAQGALTEGHVRALAGALNARTAERFAEYEARLVAEATRLSAEATARMIAFWLRHADPDGPEPGPEDGPDTCHIAETLEGRLKGRFDLGGDTAARIKALLDEKVTELLARDRTLAKVDPSDPLAGQPMAQRRARALIELIDTGASATPTAARRPLFVIHTNLDTITETGDPFAWRETLEADWSSLLPRHVRDLHACDASIARLVLSAKGVPLDLGRSVRTATAHQRHALAARDHGCAVPGCDRPPAWCDAHHIVHWTRGGRSDLHNLVLTCRHHHTRIHQGHLHVHMHHERPRFTRPDGTILREPQREPPRQPAPARRPRPGTGPPATVSWHPPSAPGATYGTARP